MKTRLLLSVLAVLAIGVAPAAAQGLLGDFTAGFLSVTANRQQNNTDTDVAIGGGNSRNVLGVNYGEVGGETGSANVGIPGFADLGSYLPGFGSLSGVGGLTGLLPGFNAGTGDDTGDTVGAPSGTVFSSIGNASAGAGASTSQLAYLASLIAANRCGVNAGANVVVVDISNWLKPTEMAGLGSVIASNAGGIAACQATLSQMAAALGLSRAELARIIAVDTRGGNVVLYMA